MDELRWILLGLGAVLIVAVYLWGRSQNKSSPGTTDKIYETPSFSATEDDDQWVDGVGPVRVVTSDEQDTAVPGIDSDVEQFEDVVDQQPDPSDDTDDTQQSESVQNEEPVEVDDVVSLFLVVAKDKVINGEHIYSACLGNNLQYGEMKIFHRMNEQGEIVFSLSDMMKPGWFEIDKINDHRTRGISLFVQLSMVADPVNALDDMLLCAHSISNLLGAQLCGEDRMLLNESTVKMMREKAKRFDKTDQSSDV